jgi:hypothetical protein
MFLPPIFSIDVWPTKDTKHTKSILNSEVGKPQSR